MSVRTDRVRAIGIFKARAGTTSDKLNDRAAKMVETVKALPILQQNLLKYEVSFKAETGAGTLANALGLHETDLSVMILAEAESHEKLRQTLTDPGYRKLLAAALEHLTTAEDFTFFPAEFITIIEK
ncbi:hypothetical protein DFH09DRAFT_1376041 [Mycena vulgaris]|nr:hypothetical protein DFH09DRAFT_1376041 [Mycena vulgaris]